ncbi:hypothetical protein Bca4012_037588 [Brassica carinata]
MEADLEPGFAWMVMATEEGARRRKHDGNLKVLSAVGFAVVDAAELLFFPFFVGAMKMMSTKRKKKKLKKEKCEEEDIYGMIVPSNLEIDKNGERNKGNPIYPNDLTVFVEAESALEFLRKSEHDINLVIWDFHMPGINGIQALKIICTKMDLPVVIISDDNRTASVMKAIVHGACVYVMKPVRKEIIANIWQHIVRKRMTSKLGLIPPVKLDVVHNQDSFKQDKYNSLHMDQGNSEQKINMIGENRAIQSVQSNGLDQDNNDSWTTSPYNGEQNMDREERKQLKKRMAWTNDLQEKFLKAVDDLGGAKKANPKPLLKMLEDMNIKGLTRRNVCSHLQKYRLSLRGKQNTQQMQEFGWSSAFSTSPLLCLKNFHTATSSLINGGASCPIQENQYQNGYMEVNNNNTESSSLMTGRPTYPVQDNQYQNGYMEVNDNHAASSSLMNSRVTYPVHENQFQNGYMEPEKASSNDILEDLELTYTMPCLPYDLGHENHLQQQQQHQISHQWNNVIVNNEPELASGNGVTGLEGIYPSLPYDPKEAHDKKWKKVFTFNFTRQQRSSKNWNEKTRTPERNKLK